MAERSVTITTSLLFGDFDGASSPARQEAGAVEMASLHPADVVAVPSGGERADRPERASPARVSPRAPTGQATARARPGVTTPRAPVMRGPDLRSPMPPRIQRQLPTPTRRPDVPPTPQPAPTPAASIGPYDFSRHSTLGQGAGTLPTAARPAKPSHAEIARQAEADARRHRYEFAERIKKGGSIADPSIAPRRREPAGPPMPSVLGPLAPIGLRKAAPRPAVSTPGAPYTPPPSRHVRTTEHFTRENARALRETAARLKVPPEELAQIIAHETNDTFSPRIWGGKNRRYMGLVQFGPSERLEYGAHDGQTFPEQLGAVERFALGRGFKPGEMGQLDLYSTVLAGRPGLYNRRDKNGSVAQHVARMQKQHDAVVRRFLDSDRSNGGSTPSAAAGGATPATGRAPTSTASK